jgi:hypothetical protein
VVDMQRCSNCKQPTIVESIESRQTLDKSVVDFVIAEGLAPYSHHWCQRRRGLEVSGSEPARCRRDCRA